MRRIWLGMGLLLLQTVSMAEPMHLGHVYPIAEQDLLVVLRQRAASLEVQTLLRRAIKHALQILPDRSQLPRANTVTQTRWCPQVTIPALGKVPAKTVPLLRYVMRFPVVLVLNVDDALQCRWLRVQLAKYPEAVVIATGGNLPRAMQRFQHWITYDAQGDWVRRFALTALPAAITSAQGIWLTKTVGVLDA